MLRRLQHYHNTVFTLISPKQPQLSISNQVRLLVGKSFLICSCLMGSQVFVNANKCSLHMKNHSCCAAWWALITVDHSTVINTSARMELMHKYCHDNFTHLQFVYSPLITMSMMINWSSINHDNPRRYCNYC